MSEEKKPTYSSLIKSSEAISWSITDLIPKDFTIDLSSPLLPISLTLENNFDFLNKEEKLAYNQIRGASYINFFAFLEEFIADQFIGFSSSSHDSSKERMRVLLRTSEEELSARALVVGSEIEFFALKTVTGVVDPKGFGLGVEARQPAIGGDPDPAFRVRFDTPNRIAG